jgi:hypothetical protein
MDARAHVLSSVGIACALAAGSAKGAVPPALWAQQPGAATFVRADSVFRAAGEVDSTLFSPQAVRTIGLYTSLPEKDGCVHLGPVLRDYPNHEAFSSLEQATETARFVLVATVTDRAGGFSGSEAGTLLELNPSEVLKSTGGKKESTYFTFVPIGTFLLEGRSYCATHPQYPGLPEIGDQVVVFLRDPTSFASSFLALYHGTDIVVMAKDGSTRASTEYNLSPSTTAASLLRLVRSYAARRP